MKHSVLVWTRDGIPVESMVVADYILSLSLIPAPATVQDHDGCYIVPITPHWTTQIVHPSDAGDFYTRPGADD